MSKYVYTCPDVIHDRKVAKIKTLALIGGMVVLAAAGSIADWRQSKKDDSIDLEFTPEDLES